MRGQQARRIRAGFGAAVHEPGTFWRFELLEVVHLDAAAFRERDGGLCRRALRVERRLERRTAALDRAIRLPLGEPPDTHREPARRRKSLDRAVFQPGVGQALGDAIGESGGQRLQRLRRQLFGADLDQEVPVGGAHDTTSAADFSIGKPSASRLA